ncbi:MAG: EFR1 family ferrodoxin, partial [Candidatus Hodarchaeales archaeon]
MKKVAIIYHSGSGSTETVSQVIKKKLLDSCIVKLFKMNLNFQYQLLMEFDILIFGFPTYMGKPSTTATDFLEGIPVFEKPKKAFVFTTFGLFSGNCLRFFIKGLSKKNIIVEDFMPIRGPASDGAILLPTKTPLMFSYFNFIWSGRKRIDKFVRKIKTSPEKTRKKSKMPFYRWYVPINNIHNYLGTWNNNRLKRKIHILTDRCNNCNWCVINCIRGCWSEGEKFPSFNPQNCELCMKCIHNCPQRAIIYNDKY